MLQINISNKVAYTLIAVFVILTASLVVYALAPGVDTSKVYHEGTQVSVNIPNEGEKTLQQAIDDGDLNVHGSMCKLIANTKNWAVSKQSTPINVPDECKDNKACLLTMQKIRDSDDKVIKVLSGIYSQASYECENEAGCTGGETWSIFGFVKPSQIVLAPDLINIGYNGDNLAKRIMFLRYSEQDTDVYLYDDSKPGRGDEKNADQWSLHDSFPIYHAKLFYCPIGHY